MSAKKSEKPFLDAIPIPSELWDVPKSAVTIDWDKDWTPMYSDAGRKQQSNYAQVIEAMRNEAAEAMRRGDFERFQMLDAESRRREQALRPDRNVQEPDSFNLTFEQIGAWLMRRAKIGPRIDIYTAETARRKFLALATDTWQFRAWCIRTLQDDMAVPLRYAGPWIRVLDELIRIEMEAQRPFMVGAPAPVLIEPEGERLITFTD